MKPWFALAFFVSALGLFAESLTLVNTLADRPVFNIVTNGLTVTRTVAPGNRASLDPGLFSGLGEKRVPLSAGATYYMAKFGATPGLYRLGEGQVLILNQSGRAVLLTLGIPATTAFLASGNFALGALAEGKLTVEWNEDGKTQSQDLAAGVYRLVLDSPEGVGTAVSLQPWN
jgi:hypothetical protein